MTLFFAQLLTRLSCDHLYKKVIAEAEKRYCVKQLHLQLLAPPQVLQLLAKQLDPENVPNKNYAHTQGLLYQTSWALNQFKLFAWVSVCYAHFIKKELQSFQGQDFQRLSELFPRKSLDFLEYYIRSLLRQSKASRIKWTEEETHLLTQAIRDEQSNARWSEISIRLFSTSNKLFFRSAQKCREKWFNHLDPEVNREKWTQEQDLKLFGYIRQHGLKWAHISKLLNGVRTEHMVKNRYNSIVKRYQNRWQRSTKKIVDRIIEDLAVPQTKANGEVPYENQRADEVEVSEESEVEESIFALSSLSRKELETEQIKGMGEANTIISIEQELVSALQDLDIDELLFSDRFIQTQPRCPKIGDVELLQIEFSPGASLSLSDESINFMLLF